MFHHIHDYTYTATGTVCAFAGGLYALAAGTDWLAVVGTLGSLILPPAVAWIRGRTNARIARLEAENERLFDALVAATAAKESRP